MIRGLQIRMARAALGLSIRELALRAGVSAGTVVRIEHGAEALGSTLEKIEVCIQEAGVSLVSDEQGVGVMLAFARSSR